MVDSTNSTRTSPKKGRLNGNGAVRFGYPEVYDDMSDLLGDP